MKTALYRHFDADGVLLYVGISLSVAARTGSHASHSVWMDQVEHIRIVSFDTRQEAINAERLAIKNENPIHNKMHNSDAGGCPICGLINHWNTRADLALAIGQKEVVVHRWAKRGRIPAQHQQSVIEAAQSFGFTFATAAWMVAAHDRHGDAQ